MAETLKPKNEIERRKGQFLYLVENTEMNQKEIAEKLNVAPSTIHSYHRQYKQGKLSVIPIPVDMKKKVVNKNQNSGRDQELADERKAKYKYLVENFDLLQKDMADIIGVSKAAIGKYNKAYKEGKYEDISPIKPEGLEKYITSTEQSSEEEIEAKNQIEQSLNEVAGAVEIPEIKDVDIPTQEEFKQVNNSFLPTQEEIEEREEVCENSPIYFNETNTNKEEETIITKNDNCMQAAVIETSLESASSNDISSILNLFTKQLDQSTLYDFKITIKKK